MVTTKKDGFEFCAIVYPYTKYNALCVNFTQNSVDKYIKYINNNRIEQAEIVMEDLSFLEQCSTLNMLHITPPYNATKDFDFSPIYKMKEVKFFHCINQFGEQMQYFATIDYSKIKGLVELSIDANRGSKNFNNIDTLKTLRVGSFLGKKRDLSDLFSSEILDTLDLIECKEISLNGIEKSKKLTCLYISYNRSLKDISALEKVKDTLKALVISKCPKIEDFSVLEKLENLEYLELEGNNILPNLHFLSKLKNLKTLYFEYNVLDGDLTPCLDIQRVYIKNRRHYNLKDNDLPKGKQVFGNEDIEEWRRLM